ncbi:hypothetical protein DPMN_179078 [Dreissena polymorpha]|uniref:Uncharacterized protein n=1 Tax=Dreissena polymorpha TaxID=45954 RepID=A0A9D4EGA3_DREPO|nr:hypothetical protein DPMN_179078 [Dreissena polymorpha]
MLYATLYRLTDRRRESVTAICHNIQTNGQKDRVLLLYATLYKLTDRRRESVNAICLPIQTDRQKDRV